MNDYKELIETFRLVEEDEEIDIYGGALHEIADAIEQLVKERDAAVKDINLFADCCGDEAACEVCKNGIAVKNKDTSNCCHFEWRGVQE